MAYNTKLMVKVSTLYYNDNLTQDEIAKKLKISKYQVNRILKKAISTGIVKINIIDPTSGVSLLEEELEKRFGLKRAIVIENFGLSDIELKSKIGAAASEYLLEIIKDKDVIGVSWGTTVNEVVNHLPARINRDVDVVQITGGSHQLSIDLNCHDITRRLAKRFDKEPHLLFAPAIIDSKELYSLLMEEKSIKSTFEYFKKVTVALVGIGSIYPKVISTLVSTGHISKKDFLSLQENNAVGDVFSHFYDIAGKICDSSLRGRTVGMPVDILFNVPYIVGVAGGKLKSEAILGALRGKYINILITDDHAAERIISLDKKSSKSG
ncbi:MAG: sugar-binding transcriptional regulator [Actinobacteria bacterium]|nr:sugar-binding transcriptional regulator [Actinomycetota bacterium]